MGQKRDITKYNNVTRDLERCIYTVVMDFELSKCWFGNYKEGLYMEGKGSSLLLSLQKDRRSERRRRSKRFKSTTSRKR